MKISGKLKTLRIIIVLSLLIPLIAACGPNWEDIAKQRDDLKTQLRVDVQRMDQAGAKVKEWSGKFPLYYTTNHQPQLTAAGNALANINGNSSSAGWMKELDEAIEKRDKKVAKERIGQIQEALLSVSTYTELILGPPGSTGQGFYESLQAKVDLLHDGYVKGDIRDLLQEAKDLDSTTMVAVQTAVPFNLCGSSTQMSFKDARAFYGLGVGYIRSAEQVISDGDEPAASDLLVSAFTSLNNATGSITTAPNNHQLAVNAISSANSSKVLADLALLNLFADYWYNVSSEHGSGVDDLTNAQIACEAEDFTTSVAYANNAEDHFNSAVYWSTQEEEEEVYIPPADDDDPIDPWSYESEDTTPNDDNSWEYESEDDNSWDYEYDDSDSWDYEYDDSDSWDYEYDDSDSWDYEYDDSSSWDNSLFARREEILQLIKPLFEWIKNE